MATGDGRSLACNGSVPGAHDRRAIITLTALPGGITAPDRDATRRRLLALAAGSTAALAGCLSGSDDADDPASGDGGESQSDGGVATDPSVGLDLPVADEELQRGASPDAIPAIVDPAFAEDWAGLTVEYVTQVGATEEIEPRLEDNDPVIGIARDEGVRAYPFRVLNWHEIVNDSLGGPLLVTYCPLCRSALTADRRVDGEETVFGVSGLLFRDALVMYDEATDSLWSQLAARAIQGQMTGASLDLEAATITSWGAWREDHPETVVLLPPPESDTVVESRETRNYDRNPYDDYQDDNDEIGLGDGGFDDDRLPAKTEVIGIANDSVARAYARGTLVEVGLVEDSVGGLPVVVTTTADGTPVAWVRRVDGEALSFSIADESHIRAGGSRWTRASGIAVDGPHEGQQLDQANAISPLFWFAWLDLHPDSELHGHEG